MLRENPTPSRLFLLVEDDLVIIFFSLCGVGAGRSIIPAFLLGLHHRLLLRLFNFHIGCLDAALAVLAGQLTALVQVERLGDGVDLD